MVDRIQFVDGEPERVVFTDEKGCYVPIHRLSARQQVARNQYWRQYRKEKRLFLREIERIGAENGGADGEV